MQILQEMYKALQFQKYPGLGPQQAQSEFPDPSHISVFLSRHPARLSEYKKLSQIYFHSKNEKMFWVCCFPNSFLIKIWRRNHCSVMGFSQDTTRACQLTTIPFLLRLGTGKNLRKRWGGDSEHCRLMRGYHQGERALPGDVTGLVGSLVFRYAR